MALRHAREQQARVLAICNTNGSTIPRESDAVLYTHAGPEVAVASTKGYTTQIVACFLVGLYLGQVRGTKFGDEIGAIVDDLRKMPDKVAAVLDQMDPVRALARDLRDATTVLFLGRHVGYPIALEGALKLKELAYMHAEGFAAGELKHGPIALIEDGLPVIAVVPSPLGRGSLHDKIVSNLQEVRARGARTIVIAEEGDEAVVPYADHIIRVPASPTLLQPLVATVPLQVFACEMAAARGHDVDQPRNLAKSVTVEDIGRPSAQVRAGRAGRAPGTGRARLESPLMGRFVDSPAPDTPRNWCVGVPSRGEGGSRGRSGEVFGEQVHQQAVAPDAAARAALVAAQHADPPEADLLIAADGRCVRERGVDGHPVVPEVVEQVAHHGPDRVGAEPAAVDARVEDDVDARVPVLRIGLLPQLHHPDHVVAVALAHRESLRVAVRIEREVGILIGIPPAGDLGGGQDRAQRRAVRRDEGAQHDGGP